MTHVGFLFYMHNIEFMQIVSMNLTEPSMILCNVYNSLFSNAIMIFMSDLRYGQGQSDCLSAGMSHHPFANCRFDNILV